MSERELRALGIGLLATTTEEKTADNATDATPADVHAYSATMATTATQVNPFHDSIDLTSAEGNKLYQKAT